MSITQWEIRRAAVGQSNVTHGPAVAEHADTVLQMKDGTWI